MRFSSLVQVASVAWLSLGATFCAQSVPATPNPPPAQGRDLSTLRVSIRARDMEVGEVLGSFARQIGARLVLDSGIKGKISIETREAKLQDVMNDLCIAFECDWSLSAGDPPDLIVKSGAE